MRLQAAFRPFAACQAVRLRTVCAGVLGSGQLCASEAFRATGGSTEQLCSAQDPISISGAKGSGLAVILKYFEGFQNPLQMSLDTCKKIFRGINRNQGSAGTELLL